MWATWGVEDSVVVHCVVKQCCRYQMGVLNLVLTS